jgi:hypothetical protein
VQAVPLYIATSTRRSRAATIASATARCNGSAWPRTASRRPRSPSDHAMLAPPDSAGVAAGAPEQLWGTISGSASEPTPDLIRSRTGDGPLLVVSTRLQEFAPDHRALKQKCRLPGRPAQSGIGDPSSAYCNSKTPRSMNVWVHRGPGQLHRQWLLQRGIELWPPAENNADGSNPPGV